MKYVRFNNRSSENLFTPNKNGNLFGLRKPSLSSIKDGMRRGFERVHGSLSSIAAGIRRGFDRGSQRMKSLRRWQEPPPQKIREPKKRRILDPQGNFLQQWNKIFAVSCIIAVSLDPLFFYIPVIVRDQFCLTLDKKVEIAACALRSLVDMFYVFHIVLQFRTGFIAPPSRVFGRGELVEDSGAIAKRYLKSYFVVDVLSILPLPQAVVLMVRQVTKGPISHATKELLKAVIYIQYIPRIWRIFPLYREVTRTSGIFTETAWAGAAFNLFLYMLASHVTLSLSLSFLNVIYSLCLSQ